MTCMSCYVAARFVLLVCGVSLSLFICLCIQPCNCDITVLGKSGAVLRTSWIFEALDKSNIFLLSPPVRLHEIDDLQCHSEKKTWQTTRASALPPGIHQI
ncbi:hypothetical protein DFJ58DRAFT_803232 [Suillus subalutaceus]|uniref:uncharacterized protein n=1 Tax=Suillus subalutaceus TaxID=48586 RepID=UPI001B87AE86|nr:uncharacterized protein DFJ58DRAFT_803232 [Suillus subalutaceus]KAG1844212.1 hypothetical protein DFJ58DRAFT_803232 [Suillus subalutaceus]